MKKTWKSVERTVASIFGTERTPLSGGNSKITRSDTLSKDFFIECKYRKKHTAVTLFEATKELAKKEGKIPIVVLAEKGKHGKYILFNSNDFKNIVEIMVELWNSSHEPKGGTDEMQ